MPLSQLLQIPDSTYGPLVQLPGGLRIGLAAREPDALWILLNEFGHEQDRVHAFEPVLVLNTFSITAENRSLDKLRTINEQQYRVLSYSGFIVSYLYLDHPQEKVVGATYAARLCHLLIRFWRGVRTTDPERAHRPNFALPMLWQTYWRALDVLAHLSEAVPDWTAYLTEEYDEAQRNWLQICLDDTHAWFFAEWLAPWKGMSSSDWQRVRENEVNSLVWEKEFTTLHTAHLTNSVTRQQIGSLIEGWYLPRYDLRVAKHLYRQLWPRRHFGNYITLGVTRLWAAILVGFLVTGLQSDTWKTLFHFGHDHIYRGIIFTLLLTPATYIYLNLAISRKIGFRERCRVLSFWILGEGFAIGIACLATTLLAPLLLTSDQAQALSLWTGGLIALVYAQLALFIGIFTQLLFDEKPTTIPVEAG